MTAFSDHLENSLLDHTLGTASFTAVSQAYMALFTTDPGDDDTGTEVSGAGYARQSVNFNSASGGSADNSNEVKFTASGGSFGTITHVGLYDDSTGGNFLYHVALSSGKTINDGESFVYEAGNFTVTLD